MLATLRTTARRSAAPLRVVRRNLNLHEVRRCLNTLRSASRRPPRRRGRCQPFHAPVPGAQYQSAALMKEKGVTVPFGLPCTTVEEAVAAGV